MAAAQSKEITRRPDRTPLSQRDPVQLAQHFAASGYFTDAADMSKAVVKICAGEELGIGPMGSMQGIHIIEGKPSLSANLLASLVKKHDAYDYVVRDHDADVCRIEFFQNGDPIGTSEFTIEEAQQAELVKPKSGWVKYPKAMLFARAMSQGVRFYCPDVTAGAPAYVPEELGAEVDEQGEVTVVPDAAAPVSPELVASAEVVEEGEPEDPTTISEEQFNEIVQGLRLIDAKNSDLHLMLGSIGADAPKINRKDSVHKALRALTPEQGDQLLVLINAEADRGE